MSTVPAPTAPVGASPRPAPRRALTLAAAVMLAVAGCSAPLPAPAGQQTLDLAWPGARAALDSATSLSITARWSPDPGGGDPTGAERSLSVAGAVQEGPYRGTSESRGGTTETIVADGVTFVRASSAAGDGASGAGAAAYAEVPAGSWIALQDDGGGLTTPKDLVDALRERLPAPDALRGQRISPTAVTVEGRRLSRYPGVPVEGGPVDLYLDAHGRLARIERSGEGPAAGPQEADVVVLEQWDAVPPVSAPPSAEVFARPGL